MPFRLFAGLPTKPIFYLALAIFAGILSYHYGSTYQRCTSQAELRAKLRAAIQAQDQLAMPKRVHLSRITDFEWDRADVLVNYKPDGATANCPFGWDWSRAERAALVAEDLLTVIVFSSGGKIRHYIEYRRDWADFVQIQNPYTPKTAVFQVRRSPTNEFDVVLTPVASET
jgi:hypothetical protein